MKSTKNEHGESYRNINQNLYLQYGNGQGKTYFFPINLAYYNKYF